MCLCACVCACVRGATAPLGAVVRGEEALGVVRAQLGPLEPTLQLHHLPTIMKLNISPRSSSTTCVY